MGSIGTSWLGIASSPTVASTAEKAISSGTKRRDQCAEGEHEDDQRDRQRGRLRLSQVLREDRFQRLVGAGVAELLDPDARVGALRRRGRGEARIDPRFRLFGIAWDLELDQRRVAVGRDLAAALGGRAEMSDRRRGPQAPRGVGEGGIERRVAGLQVPALDQDQLGVRLQLGRFERGLGPPGLSGHGFGVAQGLLPHGAADEHGENDEGEPSEDGDLAVRRAPAGGAGCDVGPGLHRVPFGGLGGLDATRPGSQCANRLPMRLAGVRGCGSPTAGVWISVPPEPSRCRTIER